MMDNFVYHNPVKILFGADTIEKIGSEIAPFSQNILMVSGKHAIKANGIYNKVITSLGEHDIRYTELDDVQANPLLSRVHKGIEISRDCGCNAILAVGGGSVIDSAKAIAAGVPVNHDVWKFFTGKKSIQEALPVFSVPTVAGSGSEINHAMVLTHDEHVLKLGFAHRKLYPKACIADPSATFSVPQEQTGFGCVDILCHCLEPYFSTHATGVSLQTRFLENICKSIVESGTRLMKDPSSYDDRATMLWSGSLAMSSMASAGLGRLSFSLHLIEHGLSAIFNIAHGAGLAAVLPGWLKYNRERLRSRIARFGKQVFSVTGRDDKDIAEETIVEIEHFLRSIQCPLSLEEVGISIGDFTDLTQHCLRQAQIWRMQDHDEKTIMEILHACYSGG